jgi:hypothetical protein
VSVIRYCLNGHWEDTGEPVYIGRPPLAELRQQAAESLRLARVKYCDRCGAELIGTCPECDCPIKHASDQSDAPRYCRGCGSAYPWTVTALNAAREYTDQINTLTIEAKSELKGSFGDLTMDTPRTAVAATRFKRILNSAGPAAKDVLIETLKSTLTSLAKELLGIKG